MTFQPFTLQFGFNYFFLSIFGSVVVFIQGLGYYFRSRRRKKTSSEKSLYIHYGIFTVVCLIFASLTDTSNALMGVLWIAGNFILYFTACFFVVEFDQLFNEAITNDGKRTSLLSLRSTVQGLIGGVIGIFLGYGIEFFGNQVYLFIALVPVLCMCWIGLIKRGETVNGQYC